MNAENSIQFVNMLRELRAELGVTNALLREIAHALKYKAELDWRRGPWSQGDGTRPPWPAVMPKMIDEKGRPAPDPRRYTESIGPGGRYGK